MAVGARERSQRYRPTIAGQRAPVAVRTEDVASCKRTGASIARGLGGGMLDAVSMVAGPAGPVCQMRIVATEGVAIVTELDHGDETWLMTCNHAPRDEAAEAVCQETLAGFRFERGDDARTTGARR